jgi:hypothetical protein
LLFLFALDYTVRKKQGTQKRLKLNGHIDFWSMLRETRIRVVTGKGTKNDGSLRVRLQRTEEGAKTS